MLELLSFIDETYGVRVAEDELVLKNLDSIASIVEFIQLKAPAASRA